MNLNLNSTCQNPVPKSVLDEDDPSPAFLEFQTLVHKAIEILLKTCTRKDQIEGFQLWKTLEKKIEDEIGKLGHQHPPCTDDTEQAKELSRASLDLEQEIRNLVNGQTQPQPREPVIIINHGNCDLDALIPSGGGNLTELVPAIIPNLGSGPGLGDAITVSNLLDDDKALESVVEDVIGLEEEKNRKNLEEIQQEAEIVLRPPPLPSPSKDSECKLTKESVEESEKSAIISTKCRASLANEMEVVAHKKEVHTKVKNLKCPRCSYTCTLKGNLNVHIRSHTGEKPFPCTKCTARFSTSGNLRRHLLSHQGLKPYRCPVCENTFTEKKSLLRHTRIHTGEKPFKCPECSKEFSQRSVLQAHLALHSNANKPFGCDKCNSTFRKKSHLTRHHNYVHIRSKSYHCTECDASFVTIGDLKRHETAHKGSGEKSFICEICGLKFMRKYNLKNHIDKKHVINGVSSQTQSKSDKIVGS